MSNARRFAKNSLALSVASLSITLLGMVYRIFIANYLSKQAFGDYTFIITFVSYFSALSLFGIRSVVTREVARSPEQHGVILRHSLKIRFITTLLAFVLAYTLAPFFKGGQNVGVGILVHGISLFAVAAMDIVEGMIVAREASVYITISSVVCNAIKIVVGIWALKHGYGLIAILWIYTIVSMLNTVMSWAFYLIVFQGVGAPKPGGLSGGKLDKFLVRESVPFVLMSLVSKVYYKNDQLIISKKFGNEELAVYAVAYTPVDALLNIANSINNAAYPIMSRLAASNPEDLRRFQNNLSRYMLLLFLPMAILLMAAGPELMSLVFRKDYHVGAPIIRLLGWMPPAEAVTYTMGSLLAATYNQRLTAKLTVVNATINLGLCLLLIPPFKFVGAALGTVVSGYITLIIVAWVVSKRVHKVDWWQSIIKPLICGFAAAGFLQLIIRITGPWLGLTAGIAAFMVFVVVTKTVGFGDLETLKTVFNRSRASESIG